MNLRTACSTVRSLPVRQPKVEPKAGLPAGRQIEISGPAVPQMWDSESPDPC